MQTIKLANDAASIVAVTLQDYINNELKWDPFIKALYQNFPKEVAEHVETTVSQIIQYQEAKEANMLPG
jgi:hypothetical protein